jgi:transketolase
MVVVAPGDPIEAAHATRAVTAHSGPCYLRLGKAGEPLVHKGPIDFQLGRAITVYEGRDITIIATGAMLEPCSRAAAVLEESGVSTRLLSMHTIKPIDAEAICRAADQTGAILTVEEHSVIGGLGGAVAEVLAQQRSSHPPFRIMGLHDNFCREIGSQEHLRITYGLAVPDIVKAARTLAGQAVAK